MDEMDFYLSRCVKNWAGKQQPPKDGLLRLIMAAKSPPVQREKQIVRFVSYCKGLLFENQEFYIEGDWRMGPITQSRAWSFHLATNWRLAH